MDRILLFIPMYNCEKQIIRVLKQLKAEICQYLSEVIIVNNRSTDCGEEKVIEYLKNTSFSIPICLFRNNMNYGLGGSHKVAFDYAVKKNFDYIIVLHGDDQGDISNILPYLKNKDYQKYDCFLGARFMKKSRLQGYSRFRTFGNKVYNLFFTIATKKKIYDLGSGLNLYRVKILRNKFYLKYKDNLMFNYCMILGSSYYKHKIKFFPIIWREEDQVSNVKIVSQAIIVLRLLFDYIIHKKRFIEEEHRDQIIKEYKAEIIFTK